MQLDLKTGAHVQLSLIISPREHIWCIWDIDAQSAHIKSDSSILDPMFFIYPRKSTSPTMTWNFYK
jgi:hypothetical protein